MPVRALTAPPGAGFLLPSAHLPRMHLWGSGNDLAQGQPDSGPLVQFKTQICLAWPSTHFLTLLGP